MKIHTSSNLRNHSKSNFTKQILQHKNHIIWINLSQSFSPYASLQERHSETTRFYIYFANSLMNEIKIYKEMTYIHCYDWEIYETTASLEVVENLRKNAELYIRVWDTLINKSNIKTITKKQLSDVEQIIYSQEKPIRELLQADVEKRYKDWLRVNVPIVQNLLSKYQQ